MTINRIAFYLLILLSLFAIYCSMVIGMSWDEPQNHWQGAIRADYLKSFEVFESLEIVFCATFALL